MEDIMQWFKQIAFMAVLISCLLKFVKSNKEKKYISLVAGLIMSATLFLPVISVLGGSNYYNRLRRYINFDYSEGYDRDYMDNDIITELLEEKMNNQLAGLLADEGYALESVVYSYAKEEIALDGNEMSYDKGGYVSVDITVRSLEAYGGKSSSYEAGQEEKPEEIFIERILVNAGSDSTQAVYYDEADISGTDNLSEPDEELLKSVIADFYNLDMMHINVNITGNGEKVRGSSENVKRKNRIIVKGHTKEEVCI